MRHAVAWAGQAGWASGWDSALARIAFKPASRCGPPAHEAAAFGRSPAQELFNHFLFPLFINNSRNLFKTSKLIEICRNARKNTKINFV
jgi:hypothetical protein